MFGILLEVFSDFLSSSHRQSFNESHQDEQRPRPRRDDSSCLGDSAANEDKQPKNYSSASRFPLTQSAIGCLEGNIGPSARSNSRRLIFDLQGCTGCLQAQEPHRRRSESDSPCIREICERSLLLLLRMWQIPSLLQNLGVSRDWYGYLALFSRGVLGAIIPSYLSTWHMDLRIPPFSAYHEQAFLWGRTGIRPTCIPPAADRRRYHPIPTYYRCIGRPMLFVGPIHCR